MAVAEIQITNTPPTFSSPSISHPHHKKSLIQQNSCTSTKSTTFVALFGNGYYNEYQEPQTLISIPCQRQRHPLAECPYYFFFRLLSRLVAGLFCPLGRILSDIGSAKSLTPCSIQFRASDTSDTSFDRSRCRQQYGQSLRPRSGPPLPFLWSGTASRLPPCHEEKQSTYKYTLCTLSPLNREVRHVPSPHYG